MPVPMFIKEMYASFLRTLGLWMFIIGILALALSYTKVVSESQEFNGVLGAIGSAILSGGVFAIILKSVQFLGVFKEELTNIIYDTKYLEGRKDIEEIWRRVSKVLYKSRFPEISAQIEDTILKTYFPTDVSFYYDSLFQNLEIQFHDDDKYIEVKEDMRFTVKAADSSEIVLPYEEILFKTPSDTDKTNYELFALTVNGVSRKGQTPVTYERNYDSGNAIKASFSLTLSGANEYKIAMVHKRVQDPQVDSTKDFGASKFINTVEIHVVYPSGICVGFFSKGTPEEFEDHPGPPTILWKEYKSLIFPNQGYRLTLQRR